MTLKIIVVDGLSVETTDAGEKAIQKLQADKAALKGANDTAQATRDADATEQKRLNDEALAKKDTELATKDNEIKELKKKVLDASALDALVEKRATLIAKASGLAKDAKFAGKSDLEIMTIAVDAVNDAVDGKAFSIDKSPAYIEAAFDMAKVPEGTGDQVRDALITGVKSVDAKDNGYSKHVASLSDAWKGEVA